MRKGLISMFNMSNSIPPEKSVIFITDNCGDQFKVKLHLTEEVKKAPGFHDRC